MRIDGIALATGPVSWGVDFAETPANPPWESVLDEIAASPLSALELGPVGYLPEDGEVLCRALGERGLTAVGTFVFDDLHDLAARDRVLSVAKRTCGAIAAAGGAVLVVIDRPGDERAATAGRSDAARRMTEPEWAAMVATVETVATIARRHGLRPAVHPHAGGFLEFEDEVERLLADTSLDLTFDSGHAAYAGLDPAAAVRRWGARIAHVHLKDVSPGALARVHAERLGFWDAIAAGVFCPLGDGVVDVAALLGALADAGYRGFATIEQDRLPGTGTPLEDLRRSVAVLERAGAGAVR
jgi:inosose dehydratase